MLLYTQYDAIIIMMLIIILYCTSSRVTEQPHKPEDTEDQCMGTVKCSSTAMGGGVTAMQPVQQHTVYRPQPPLSISHSHHADVHRHAA
jgi:hypothetical protein